MHTFQQLGYEVHVERVVPTVFGVNQSRPRVYFLVIRKDVSSSDGGSMARSMMRLFDSLHLPPRPIREYLFRNDDARVTMWNKKGAPDMKGGTKWQDLHAKLYRDAGLPWPGHRAIDELPGLSEYFHSDMAVAGGGSLGRVAGAGSPGFESLTEREFDSLVFLVATRGPSTDGDEESFADLVHSLNRVGQFRTGCVPCIIPHSKIWMFRAKRLLSPEELLHIQDFNLRGCGISVTPLPQGSRPKRKLSVASDLTDEWSSHFLCDLAGNSFQASCVAVCLITIMAHTRPLHSLD